MTKIVTGGESVASSNGGNNIVTSFIIGSNVLASIHSQYALRVRPQIKTDFVNYVALFLLLLGDCLEIEIRESGCCEQKEMSRAEFMRNISRCVFVKCNDNSHKLHSLGLIYVEWHTLFWVRVHGGTGTPMPTISNKRLEGNICD